MNVLHLVALTQNMSIKIQVNDELACILNLKLIINHFSSRITLRPEKYHNLVMYESFRDDESQPCKG